VSNYAFGDSQKNNESSKTPGEYYKNLAINGKRARAVDLIGNELDVGPLTEGYRQELLETLSDISGVFYSEKTLNLFQIGESLYYKNSTESLVSLGQALEREKYNLNILLAHTRALLAANKCAETEALASRTLKNYPTSNEAQLLLAQSYSCSGQVENLKNWLSGNGSKLGAKFDLEVLALRAGLVKAEEQPKLLGKYAKQMEQIDPSYPETYYWKWKSKSLAEPEKLQIAKNYVAACRKVTSQMRKKYKLEPRLCGNYEEVNQNVLQSKEAQ